MRLRSCWIGVSAVALWSAGGAAAQTPPADPGASTEQAESSAPEQGEIIVTARRRNENLQTTPLSGSVLSGTDLANKGVANVDALQFASPSIVVNNFGQGIDFNVRGIGKGEHNTQTATGVITYRDGVPTFPGYFQQEPYYDVANIQVLRGPQGTIVGQNATGGAVFVNSNDPIIGGGYKGYVQASVGNYSELGAQGAVNIPVNDTLAARAAIYGLRRDGFYDITGPNGTDYTGNNGDQRHLAGRFSLLWKPTSQLSILSKTDVDYLDMGAYVASPYQNYRPVGVPALTQYSDLFDVSLNAPQEARDKFWRTILRINYEFDGGLQLRSVSGYSWGNTKYRADLDGTARLTPATADRTFFDSVDERQFSQELTLISPDTSRVSYLAGVFGIWNKYEFLSPFQFVSDNSSAPGPASEYRLQGTNPNRSLAAFGQLGFAITPALKAEVGGRYTASRSINDIQILQFGTPLNADQKTTSDNFSYKASLGWEANRNHYLYAFVATGFKPGGLNPPVGIPAPDFFREETVTSYEAGWKGSFANRRIRTTISGFYNSYDDFQVIIANPALPVFGLQINVPGTTKIYGFEAEVQAQFGRLNLDAGINVLHSEIGRFFAVDQRGTLSLTPCDPTTGPASATCRNLTGNDQTYAPNFTFNAGASYEIDLGGGATLTPRANFGHVGKQWATLFANPTRGDRLEDRNILNAQIAFTKGSVTVTGYANNLTNQHYPGALNSNLYFAGPPRQYGVKLLKAF
ncbi:TonB-dependent receptor [Sphingomonas rubra]|uniref:Iron complex outermembrane recepter protein n=1 Tax=Sphingomonas rubra TaxID=634430 RepID=A0A1I5RI09_9SPHN|nr:TonB-dependent receptor [Sphingomonas rubra]SFP57921.1 iron complex outermembrane recepter protein [Sphingomonas rubra]